MLEDFSDVQPTFVTEHGFVALQQLVGILTDKVKSPRLKVA